VPLRPREAAAVMHVRVGTVTKWSEEEGIIVDYAGSPNGPQPVATTMSFSAAQLDALVASRDAVLLTFEQGRLERPILVGLTQPIPSRSPHTPSREAGAICAVVDGEVVELQGSERVVLRCGKASIVLTKDGKIVLSGTYISSSSSGAHRIRGGSVEIN
jgi:hypothetical protein